MPTHYGNSKPKTKGTHKMPDGTVMSGRTHSKDSKKTTIKLGDKPIKIEQGALRKALKMKESDKFTKTELERLKKVKTDTEFVFKGKKFMMTPKLKKQVSLGAMIINLLLNLLIKF
jgi:hypothetical protein